MTTTRKKKVWFPLDLSTLPNCRIIGCDPSLTALGLVFIEVHDGVVYVLGAEKLTVPPTDKVGWEDTFERVKLMEEQIEHVLLDWFFSYGDTGNTAVYEAPPVNTGTLYRTETTTLTGYAFRRVAEMRGAKLDALATPAAHKNLICGNGRASKKEHHDEVRKLLPDLFDGKLITNEATRDALSIALYAANRKKEQW